MSEDQPIYAIHILGNPGVGKTFICNQLLGENYFLHKFSPVSVTKESETKVVQLDGHFITVVNIPGIIDNNPQRIQHNKAEIEKGFKLNSFSIVVYVFGNEGGRIRDEDFVAFQALQKAFKFDQKSVGFIINNLDPKRDLEYDGQATLLIKETLNLNEKPNIGFLNKITDLQNDQLHQDFQSELMRVISLCIPKHQEKKEELILIKEELIDLKNQFKKKQDELSKLHREDENKRREIENLNQQ